MKDEILPRILHFCRPGIVVDVGANVGDYTEELLAAEDCRVVAFEPLVGPYLTLCARLVARGGGEFPPNFAGYHVAVGEAFGLATLHTAVLDGVPAHQESSLVQDFADRDFGAAEVRIIRQLVVVVPLDSFEFQPLTLLKIDVEGAEMEVIRGARQSILRSRPVIAVELEERHREGTTEAVPALLGELGYRGFFYVHGRLYAFERFDRATLQPRPTVPGKLPALYVNNFLFAHRDDAWALARLAEI